MIPSIFINSAANGEGCGGAIVDRGLRYSRKGDDNVVGSIGWLGRNLRASGFGVFSVWINIVRLPPTDAAGWSKLVGWWRGCNEGLVFEFDADIAGSLVLWCMHLAAG